MELDYHYYAIYHFARLAGLSAQEAQTVAYASQYVDDSTESEPIEPFKDQHFDTVRTAHYNLGAFNWDVQKKIYMPFHFLPARIRWTDPGQFSYVTARASAKMDDLSAKLVDLALKENVPRLRLIRVGVALHTVADTFSHFGFSGRHNEENNVGKIWTSKKKGHWDLQLIQSYGDVFVPQIGHTEAFTYPDLPFQAWRYRNNKDKLNTRNNADYCLDGARLIYKHLKRLKDGDGQKADLEKDFPSEFHEIQKLFQTPGTKEKRCERWQKHTGAPEYSKLKWRKDALIGDVKWDDMSEGRRKYKLRALQGKKDFDSTSWAYFHRAAHIQRSQVLTWLN